MTVLGDFNFPDLDWVRDVHNSVSPESEFFHLMLSFFLKQVNTVPSNAHRHFLDLIFSNSDGLIRNVSEAHVDYDSDHIVLYFDMFLDPPKKRGCKREVYNYKKADLDNFNRLLIEYDLFNVFDNVYNVDDMWNAWRLNVMNALNECIPKIVIKNTHNPPWFDDEMRHMINKKRTAWHKAA